MKKNLVLVLLGGFLAVSNLSFAGEAELYVKCQCINNSGSRISTDLNCLKTDWFLTVSTPTDGSEFNGTKCFGTAKSFPSAACAQGSAGSGLLSNCSLYGTFSKELNQ